MKKAILLVFITINSLALFSQKTHNSLYSVSVQNTVYEETPPFYSKQNKEKIESLNLFSDSLYKYSTSYNSSSQVGMGLYFELIDTTSKHIHPHTIKTTRIGISNVVNSSGNYYYSKTNYTKDSIQKVINKEQIFATANFKYITVSFGSNFKTSLSNKIWLHAGYNAAVGIGYSSEVLLSKTIYDNFVYTDSFYSYETNMEIVSFKNKPGFNLGLEAPIGIEFTFWEPNKTLHNLHMYFQYIPTYKIHFTNENRNFNLVWNNSIGLSYIF